MRGFNRVGSTACTSISNKESLKMSRATGDRYRCDSCKAELIYVQGCPCPSTMPHSETCCGKQMSKVEE